MFPIVVLSIAKSLYAKEYSRNEFEDWPIQPVILSVAKDLLAEITCFLEARFYIEDWDLFPAVVLSETKDLFVEII